MTSFKNVPNSTRADLSKDVKFEFQQNHLSEVLMSMKRSLAQKVVTEQYFY